MNDRPATEPGALVLDREQTRAVLDPVRLVAAIRQALIAVSRDEASVPPRVAASTPTGWLGAMPGYLPGLGLAAKLVSVFPVAGRSGRSTHRGAVALFDDRDGRLLAVLAGEPITAVRTAAVATVSMQALAVPEPRRIAVIGSGMQAGAQLDLLAALGDSAELVVGGRDPNRVADLAERHPGVRADTIENAVRGADVVFCCTGATEPVLARGWLSPGTHVSSVGGSAGPELDADTIRDAALFAEWRGAASQPPPAGAHELQGSDADRVTLLGAVLSGERPGRRDEHELTVFKSTGHAALDIAAAAVGYELARAHGLGRRVEL